MSDLIKCLLCDCEFQSLVGHLRIHGMTSREYRVMFPGAKVVEVSRETRVRTSASHWSKKPIEETKHIRARLAENGRRVMQLINNDGRAFRMSKGYHTEKHKQHMRTLMTGRHVTWGDKIRNTHWSKKSAEEIQRIVDRIQQNGSYMNTKRGWRRSTKMKDDFFFMSSYEERRMIFLDTCDSVVSFTNKHNIWIDYEWNGSVHRYNPDLLVTFVDGRQRLEEIKGAILDVERTLSKERACIAYAATHSWEYRMLFEHELESL